MIRPFHHAQFPLELLRERKRESVTVVLPTREVSDTIGPIVERLLSLDGLVDQLLVVDAARCWARATRCGARWMPPRAS